MVALGYGCPGNPIGAGLSISVAIFSYIRNLVLFVSAAEGSSIDMPGMFGKLLRTLR
jgi:hypothetical protein